MTSLTGFAAIRAIAASTDEMALTSTPKRLPALANRDEKTKSDERKIADIPPFPIPLFPIQDHTASGPITSPKS
jgi:hypothetical protein